MDLLPRARRLADTAIDRSGYSQSKKGGIFGRQGTLFHKCYIQDETTDSFYYAQYNLNRHII